MPLIRQGWLRAILFVVCYFLLLVVFAFVLQMIQTKAGNDAGSRLQYIGIVVVAIVSLGFTWLFRKIIDRQSFASLGFELQKSRQHAMTGFFLGILLLCVGTLIIYFTGHLQWTAVSFNAQDLFIGLVLMIMVAVYEEIVFRGYLLNNLLQSMNKWGALVITAMLFTLGHYSNPGMSVIGAINIFAAGLLLGANYLYTRNLWFSIMLHFSWNFFQGPILGYPVSGVNLQSILQHELRGGDTTITGGAFGFEGSVVALGLYIIAIASLLFVYEKKYIQKTIVA